MYVDGDFKNSGTRIISITESNHVIGCRVVPTPTTFFTGTIDDVRLYNRVLTDDDINDLYELGNPSLCWNYTARYKNSQRLYRTNGSGPYPKTLNIPSSVDPSTGRMVDEGKLINPNNYEVL